MRLLIAEDDPQLGDGLTVGLRQAGHAVDWVRDGVAADLALQNESYDLLVLDLGRPPEARLPRRFRMATKRIGAAFMPAGAPRPRA